ncbi:MAG: hypothetical protein F6K30_05005 [Cyanothece sp. SIO2G6]|nr:hypothetical protein [Cyanothece sp. SIO2G6]
MNKKPENIINGESTEKSKATEVKEIEVFPLSSYSKIELSKQTIESLIDKNPDRLFRIVEENQRQQRQAQEQEHREVMLKLQHAQELAIKVEEHKALVERSDKNLIRFGIIAFVTLFAGVLWYSARVNDKNLPSTIFTAAVSAVAGGGLALAKSNKEEEKKP